MIINTLQPLAELPEHSEADFIKTVIEQSVKRPMLAYFSASWCSPCRSFSPMLLRAINKTKGAVGIAKFDIDKCPTIAQQLSIQSVPMTFIFIQGQAANAFAGAVSEAELQSLMTQLVATFENTPQQDQIQETQPQVEDPIEIAQHMLAEKAYGQAISILGQTFQQNPDNEAAFALLLQTFLASDQLAQAEALSKSVSAKVKESPKGQKAIRLLELHQQAHTVITQSLRTNDDTSTSALATNQAYQAIAKANYAQAIEKALQALSSHREDHEESRRKLLLALFDAVDHKQYDIGKARQRMASVLFS